MEINIQDRIMVLGRDEFHYYAGLNWRLSQAEEAQMYLPEKRGVRPDMLRPVVIHPTKGIETHTDVIFGTWVFNNYLEISDTADLDNNFIKYAGKLASHLGAEILSGENGEPNVEEVRAGKVGKSVFNLLARDVKKKAA